MPALGVSENWVPIMFHITMALLGVKVPHFQTTPKSILQQLYIYVYIYIYVSISYKYK